MTANATGGVYQSELSRYSGSILLIARHFCFAKGAGVMGEAGPEAHIPLVVVLTVLRRGSRFRRMAMFAPEYNIIEIHNDAGNGQIGPQALQAVYNIEKAAIDFWQQRSRVTGVLLRRAITMETFNWKIRPDMTVESEPKVTHKIRDGYEQRRPAGLNNHLAKYNVTVRIRKGRTSTFLRHFYPATVE